MAAVCGGGNGIHICIGNRDAAYAAGQAGCAAGIWSGGGAAGLGEDCNVDKGCLPGGHKLGIADITAVSIRKRGWG